MQRNFETQFYKFGKAQTAIKHSKYFNSYKNILFI